MLDDPTSLSERTMKAAENAVAGRREAKLGRKEGRRERGGIKGGLKGIEKATRQSQELEGLDPTKKGAAPTPTPTPMTKKWDESDPVQSMDDLNEETWTDFQATKEKTGAPDQADLVNKLIALNARRGTMPDEELRAEQLAILGGTDTYGQPATGEELSRVDQYKADVAKAKGGDATSTGREVAKAELFDMPPSVGEDGSETWKVKGDPYTYKKDTEGNITVVSGPVVNGKSETGRKIEQGSAAHRAVTSQLDTTSGGSEWTPAGGTEDTSVTTPSDVPVDETGLPAQSLQEPAVTPVDEYGMPLQSEVEPATSEKHGGALIPAVAAGAWAKRKSRLAGEAKTKAARLSPPTENVARQRLAEGIDASTPKPTSYPSTAKAAEAAFPPKPPTVPPVSSAVKGQVSRLGALAPLAKRVNPLEAAYWASKQGGKAALVGAAGSVLGPVTALADVMSPGELGEATPESGGAYAINAALAQLGGPISAEHLLGNPDLIQAFSDIASRSNLQSGEEAKALLDEYVANGVMTEEAAQALLNPPE